MRTRVLYVPAMALNLCGLTATAKAQCPPIWQLFPYPANPGSRCLLVHDDGSGPMLYLGGHSSNGGLARWNGSRFQIVGTTLQPPFSQGASIQTLAALSDSTGTRLYAGGIIYDIGGIFIHGIERFEGDWVADAPVLRAGVRALAMFDEGAGTTIFAATDAGLQRRDSGGWTQVMEVDSNALAVWDDGTGPALYCGCTGGSNIVKWDGHNLSSLGAGVDGPVFVLHVFDDGGGPALFVGGAFAHAGGQLVGGIAKWNGLSWAGVGGGTDGAVKAMCTFETSAGRSLVIGGSIGRVGTLFTTNVAAWKAGQWSGFPALPDGTFTNGVYGLAQYGSELWAVGADGSKARFLTLGASLAIDDVQPRVFELGTTATLRAIVGSPIQAEYQWRHRGVPVRDDGRITGATTPTLTIRSVMLQDSGPYDFVAINSCGVQAATQTATLSVYGVQCGPADITSIGGLPSPPDGLITGDDFIAFINSFAAGCP